MNKKMGLFLYVVLLAIYYYVIISCTKPLLILGLFGAFNVTIFRYKFLFTIVVPLIFIFLFVMPIILLFRFKDKRLRIIAALFCMMFLFFEGIKYCDNETWEHYRVFSAEEWKSYPIVRQYMYEALINENLVVGKEIDEVEELLGKADDRNDNELLYYAQPKYIHLELKDGKVVDVFYR